LLLAKVLTSEGRPSDAAAVYREAIGHRGNLSELQNCLALLLVELADPTADLALEEAIRSSLVERADLHVALGERLAARGRTEEARQQFEIAANAPTFSAATRNSKGMALLQLVRVTGAETTWREVIRDHPDFGRAWLNLASLSIQRKNWAEVEKFARFTVAREPLSAAAWNNLAIGLEELGRRAEAEAAYRKASEVDPNHPRARQARSILDRLP